MCVPWLTMHPHVIGCRSRMFILEELMRHMQSLPGVWFGTHRDVALHVKALLQAFTGRRHPDELLGHDAVLPAVPSVKNELTSTRRTNVRGSGMSALVRIPAPRAALSSAHLDVVFAAAVAGLGIVGLPSFVAHDALWDGRLQRLLPEWHGTALTLSAALPTSKHLPARTRAFVDFLVARFGGTDDDPWLTHQPGHNA